MENRVVSHAVMISIEGRRRRLGRPVKETRIFFGMLTDKQAQTAVRGMARDLGIPAPTVRLTVFNGQGEESH